MNKRMKIKKKLLPILMFIGILSAVYSGGRADEPPKYFWDHQIHLIKMYRINERTYSLAIEVSGFAEKLIFIQLYDFDITDVLDTEMEYIVPVFQDLVIDWKIDKETGEEISLKIMSYDYIPEQNKIVIKFGDGSVQESTVTVPKARI